MIRFYVSHLCINPMQAKAWPATSGGTGLKSRLGGCKTLDRYRYAVYPLSAFTLL
jgi:hypothetical protein